MAVREAGKRGTLDPVLQSLVNTHAEAFALVDRDFNVVACNSKYAEVYAGLMERA